MAKRSFRFYSNTIFIAVFPGIAHIYAQKYTVYREPRPADRQPPVKVGETPPMLQYRKQYPWTLTLWAVLNFFHVPNSTSLY